MAALAVIGNISRDLTSYPDGRHHLLLGGGALHVSLAAARAGLRTAPVSVVGHDLAWIRHDPRLLGLDLGSVTVVDGNSCTFRITYDRRGDLLGVDSTYGVAESLTSHVLNHLGLHNTFHVCCRRPLDVQRVLSALADRAAAFSVDFFTTSAAAMIAAAMPYLPSVRIAFTNAAEYRILTKTVDPTTVPAIAITDGPRPAQLLRHGHQVTSQAPPTAAPIEVTGAGDTFTGTFLASKAAGATDQAALRQAVRAASAALATLNIPLTDPTQER